MNCVRDFIIKSAESRPEQYAVESSYGRMTFRELLNLHAVEPGSWSGFKLERGIS